MRGLYVTLLYSPLGFCSGVFSSRPFSNAVTTTASEQQLRNEKIEKFQEMLSVAYHLTLLAANYFAIFRGRREGEDD